MATKSKASRKQFAHMGRKVVIDRDEREIRASIDGQPVATFPAGTKSGFYTPYLPYKEYASVEDMTKAMILYVPKFMPKAAK